MFMTDVFVQSNLLCIWRYPFTFTSVLAFPANQTHDLSIASANTLLFEHQKGFRFFIIINN